ncbi:MULTISPECIES: PEP/pyruvate-binding domain-containing protein [unclassified Streptomyces]|uniref:PEP/pyruvate-binding domain-containing protein n=1 Tax=unclassified Streptomyces TaxID=2593676 RepID=UPI002E18DC85|nr:MULTISPECIES: PEP/pyruvate-binding domain-containing protein [unclassified Streptomyces]
MPLVLDLRSIDATMLATVGGKAANLGELTRAGLPVPHGFCVTTDAYRTLSATDGLAGLEPAKARRRILEAEVPGELGEAIRAAYAGLGDDAAVAVRSSATAEDLPFASFAGQQDTYLNVVGADAVLDAVRRCWASLWTDRAVSYRETNGIDHGSVQLAVVVQQMVDSAVSGVLFTANPVTGKRDQAVIDASPGLGEAVVSGAVNPDHFVVDGQEIVERKLGDKRFLICSLAGGGTEKVDIGENPAPCLTDRQVRQLAALGAEVQAHYGSPQDTEWAIDARGALHLTQSRPITTLFPVPEHAEGDFRVYFCFSLAQGLERPITPAGRAAIREIAGAAGRIIIGDPATNGCTEAGGRIFLDVTNVLRSRTGRAFFPRVLDVMEARSAHVLRSLYDDPRLGLTYTSPWPAIRRVARLARRFHAPSTVLRALVTPKAAVRRARRTEVRVLKAAETKSVEEALRDCVIPVLPTVAPTALVGFAMLGLAGRLVRTEPGELQTVLRSLPNNVTTEMDLDLWNLARTIRAERDAVDAFQEANVQELVARYRAGELPPVAQDGLRAFLEQWGHRAVAEIDLGLPRWSDDPTHIIGVVRNYLLLNDEQARPDAVFARGAAEAEAMIERLARRAKGRGRLVRFALRRTRLLAGLREYPKYLAITLFGSLRARIAERGTELHAQGRLDAAQDVFFLDFDEMRSTDGDLRPTVAVRKEEYEREMRRRHIPRVLLSDGTEPEAAVSAQTAPSAPGDLLGTAASAGEITGHARVVTDPVGAHLEPGEILVAPSTDPGWTPLFLTAGGLVMEMGGANSHGAVVAREYGIPAVVGVPDALMRIETGDVITVDGSAGVVRAHPEGA